MSMDPFTSITSVPASLPETDIDTDIIFPARFLLLTQKKGLGQYAFYEKRFDAQGLEMPGFILNRNGYRATQILIAGDNFGSGSSREHAPWALRDFGIRCVISSSFGEIFYSNCFKNGMLPVLVTASQLAELHADADAGLALTVDLIARELVRAEGQRIAFEVAAWRRQSLLNGWDEIALILNQEGGHIARFEADQKTRMPWLYAAD